MFISERMVGIMNLQELLGGIEYQINIPSARINPENELEFSTFSHLYNYFNDYNSQSYHTLVKTKGIEEYYLLMNDQDLILLALSKYMVECEIKKETLTIYIHLYDNKKNPFEVPFIYDLNDINTLYELNKVLNQDKIDLFFIELINNILIIEHSIEIILPQDIKIHLNSEINKYINENYNNIEKLPVEQERQVVRLDEILDNKKNMDCVDRDFKKYNWVDVKVFAEKIFWNYGFEMPWAEDAWNILMFNNIVKSDDSVQTKREQCEYGDIILWLVAMYDLYFEYKAAGDYESIDDADILEYIYSLDDAEKYIGIYLKDAIYEELNNQLVEGKCNQCEFYNIETSTFQFINDDTGTSIAHDVYNKEIERRREIVENIIWEYFSKDNISISKFMEGTHWCENYLDNKKKEKKL